MHLHTPAIPGNRPRPRDPQGARPPRPSGQRPARPASSRARLWTLAEVRVFSGAQDHEIRYWLHSALPKRLYRRPTGTRGYPQHLVELLLLAQHLIRREQLSTAGLHKRLAQMSRTELEAACRHAYLVTLRRHVAETLAMLRTPSHG